MPNKHPSNSEILLHTVSYVYGFLCVPVAAVVALDLSSDDVEDGEDNRGSNS